MTELEKARFLELKEIGYQKLAGEDRVEYVELKKKFDLEDSKDSPPPAAPEDKEEEAPVDLPTPPADNVPPEDQEVPVVPRTVRYVLVGNVDVDGKLFPKDMEVTVDHPQFAFLFKNNFLKEV